MHFKYVTAALAAATGCLAARPMGIGRMKALQELKNAPSGDDVDPSKLYPAQKISVPIDHFHNESRYEPHSSGTYEMRYWFDATYYKPGGPVLVLCSGEDTGVDRLPYLQKGIIYELAKATNGLGVVVEHRYYGNSWPVPNLSTENMRFLTTDQSIADTTYFANNVKFPGLEHLNLTAKNAPWIAYGGSYAGAYVAIMRTVYPETWWGAISSSGVSRAQWDYHQYYDPIAQFGPSDCINKTQTLTHAMDYILLHNTTYTQELKALFGLSSISSDADFMSTVSDGIGGWQSLNWDPAVSDPSVYQYCSNISSSTIQYSKFQSKVAEAEKLLTAGGYGKQAKSLAPHLLNWAGWLDVNVVGEAAAAGLTAEEYFGTQNATYYAQDDIAQSWRSWPYQYCTQWGFLQVGSTVPKNQLPLISRTITLHYSATICRQAFNLTQPAKTEEINKYGGFNIAAPRLAQIGGQWDPWRPVTPLADAYLKKPSTQSQPRVLISKAVHHWDENGLFPNQTTPSLPPAPVKQAQSQELEFVKAWVGEYHSKHY